MITQSELKEILDYDSKTGAFTWRVNRGSAIVGGIAGALNPNGYRRIVHKGRLYAAHRLAWLYIHGEFPPEHIDHINHQRGDNRLANLRAATSTENQRNRSLSHTNTSGVHGVHFDKSRDKWRAGIQVNGRLKYLGRFDDIDDAVAARQAANAKYGFHQNHGALL